jgi:hypothetical protein
MIKLDEGDKMLIFIFSIVFWAFLISMLIVAKGIEEKEESAIECELKGFCEIEKQSQCKIKKSKSFNYLTLT